MRPRLLIGALGVALAMSSLACNKPSPPTPQPPLGSSPASPPTSVPVAKPDLSISSIRCTYGPWGTDNIATEHGFHFTFIVTGGYRGVISVSLSASSETLFWTVRPELTYLTIVIITSRLIRLPSGHTLFETTVTLDPSNVIIESDETNNATVLHFDTRDVIPVDVRPTTVMDVPCWP